MKPVTQTETGEDGNCERAAIASIFEVTLDDVPDFRALDQQGESWWWHLSEWCAARGVRPLRIGNVRGAKDVLPIGAYCVVGGVGPRGIDHSLVGKVKNRWGTIEIVHDPHPEANSENLGEGFEREDLTFFVAVDPAHAST